MVVENRQIMIVAIKREKGGPVRILVVDDEPAFRKIIKKVLIRDGHSVSLAGDGKEGLKILANEEIDIVFTDINMPEMSGWEFLRQVHKLYPKLPAAVITGLPSHESHPPNALHSTERILRKPVRINEIRELIEELQ